MVKTCRICGRAAADRHHVFGGAKRKKSEEYGLVVWLCRECHDRVHFGESGRKLMDALRKEAQAKFEREHPDKDFLKEFGRNYLDDAERRKYEGIDIGEELIIPSRKRIK